MIVGEETSDGIAIDRIGRRRVETPEISWLGIIKLVQPQETIRTIARETTNSLVAARIENAITKDVEKTASHVLSKPHYNSLSMNCKRKRVEFRG